MLQTLLLYWGILWRRRLPSDLPYSMALCVITGLLCALVNLPLNQAFAHFVQIESGKAPPPMPGLLPLVIIIALGAAVYGLVVRVFGQAPRALQTMTAILGITLLTAIAMLALLSVVNIMPTGLAGPRRILFLAMIVIWLYNVYIESWVLSQAIERPIAMALPLVIALEIFVFVVGSLLLGAQAAGT
jgi:hypothetical protein